MNKTPSITVSIKTLNEAQGIEKTIDSVRKQLQPYPHQIIVADSLSTDNTRELAIAKDAMVVCLDNAKDRCCGVGHQLGWLFSEGDYLLLLDGDMELEPGFLDTAVAFLEEHPEYAGVAGSVEMDDAANYELNRASSACILFIRRVIPTILAAADSIAARQSRKLAI